MENERAVEQNETEQNNSDNNGRRSSSRIRDKRMRLEKKAGGGGTATGRASRGMPSEVAVQIMNKLSLPNVMELLKVFRTWAPNLPLYSPEQPQAPWLWQSGARRGFRPRYLTSVVDGSTVRYELPGAERGLRCLGSAGGMMLVAAPFHPVSLLNPLFPEREELTLPPLPWELDHHCHVVLSAPRRGDCMALAFRRKKIHLWAEGKAPGWQILTGYIPKSLTMAAAVGQRFFAIDTEGGVWVVDPNDKYRVLWMATPRFALDADRWDLKGYLAELRGEVLFIWPEENYAVLRSMEVFMLNTRTRRWIPQRSLGGAAVFVSAKGSVVLERAAEAGCRPDCVYYVPYPREATWSVYDMADGSVTAAPRTGLCPANTAERAWVVPRLPWPDAGVDN